jgi:hypothetical protein
MDRRRLIAVLAHRDDESLGARSGGPQRRFRVPPSYYHFDADAKAARSAAARRRGVRLERHRRRRLHAARLHREPSQVSCGCRGAAGNRRANRTSRGRRASADCLRASGARRPDAAAIERACHIRQPPRARRRACTYLPAASSAIKAPSTHRLFSSENTAATHKTCGFHLLTQGQVRAGRQGRRQSA